MGFEKEDGVHGRKKVIWANTPLEEPDSDRLFFFPGQGALNRALGTDLIEQLQSSPASFYAVVTDSLGKAVADEFHIPLAAATTLVRDAVAVLSYAFIDRMLRFFFLARENNVGQLTVARAPRSAVIPESLEGIGSAITGSQPFNQFMLECVSRTWEVELVDYVAPQLPGSKKAVATSKNYNFRPPSLLDRVRWKSLKWLSSQFGKIPAAGLAYSEPDLLQANLFAPGRIAYLMNKPGLFSAQKNQALRGRLLRPLQTKCRETWLQLWSQFGIEDEAICERGLAAYIHFLTSVYPPDRLEAIPKHFPAALKKLRRFRGGAIIFSGMADVYSLYLLAAAKGLEWRVIGTQHGAHYGIVDAPCHREVEYPHCDIFVTWGNRRLPSKDVQGRLSLVPLPTPWLSERRKNWMKLTGAPGFYDRQPRYDVLFVTDRLQEYPPSITTLRMSRVDFLDDIAAWLDGAVRTLCASDIRILHKPFNRTSLDLLGDLSDRLVEKWSDQYVVYDRLDKGLTSNLIEECAVVVWDEPGSGFFECLVSGIPTMLFWPRLVSKEAEHLRGLFDLLASVGIAHESAASLRDTLLDFRSDAAAWMCEEKRRVAISEVCRELAWCDNDWKRFWLNFIRAV